MPSKINLDWSVQAIRLTAFPVASPDPTLALDWWRTVLGQEPETHTTRPREAVSDISGLWGSVPLHLRTQPFRVDWLAQASETDQPTSSGESALPGIGSYPKVSGEFLRMAETWLPHAPSLSRLAFGAILMLPVSGREEGYALVNKLLPAVDLDGKASRDFSYQINRRRLSMALQSEVPINRLSKWSVARQSLFTTQISDQEGIQSSVPTSEQSAVRLELDINTAPENDEPFSNDNTVSILKELMDLAGEIAEKGDIP